jgi:Holliday junction resolvase
MRLASKRDRFHAQISKELREAGFCVVDLSRVGSGCPDLAISRGGVWCLVELKTLKYVPKLVKTRVKTASEGRGASQIDFHAKAKGPIITAYAVSEIVWEFNLLLKLRQAYALAG